MLLVFSREMRVTQCHLDVLMTHQVFHRGKINPRHHQATGKGVPQIVKGEILNIRPPDRPLKHGSEGAVGRFLRLRKTRSVVGEFILIALSVAVKTLFIGTLRLSPFFAYTALTVIIPR